MNMEGVRNNSGQNLGIAALVTGIITLVIAVIPCMGVIAFIPGIIAVILAAIGLTQAQKDDSPRGVILAGLIIAVVATLVSFSQWFAAGKIAKNLSDGKWTEKIENIVDEVEQNVIKDIEDANVSIKVENGDEKVEINIGTGKSEKETILEELESGKNPNDSVPDPK
jgi:thiol:disulfide interchange protein